MYTVDNDFLHTYQQQKINYFLLLRDVGEDTDYIWTVDSNNDATLIYYVGNKRSIKVPTTIGGYPVKYIAPTCYADLDFVTSAVIPEGVTEIN